MSKSGEQAGEAERLGDMEQRSLAKKRWRLSFLLGVFVLSLLVGCAPATAGRSATITDVTITYRRDGGLTGRGQEWVIHMDGRIEAPGDLEMQAPPADVAAVLEQGAAMPAETATAEPAPCCDRFTYTLTFSAGEQQKTFTIYDGVETEALEMQMFAAVESLINTAEPLP